MVRIHYEETLQAVSFTVHEQEDRCYILLRSQLLDLLLPGLNLVSF